MIGRRLAAVGAERDLPWNDAWSFTADQLSVKILLVDCWWAIFNKQQRRQKNNPDTFSLASTAWRWKSTQWWQILIPGCIYCTQFGRLILRKIIKIVATRCQILWLKCTKFNFGWSKTKTKYQNVIEINENNYITNITNNHNDNVIVLYYSKNSKI